MMHVVTNQRDNIQKDTITTMPGLLGRLLSNLYPKLHRSMWRGLCHIGLLLTLVGVAGVLSNAGQVMAQSDEGGIPPPQSITPIRYESVLCRQQCIDQPIEIVFPPVDVPPPLDLDLLFLMDISGSMGSELNVTKSSIGRIINTLRTEVPDMRFAFGVFSDYGQITSSSGDTPFTLISGFTQDLPQFQSRIDGIGLEFGGDRNETAVRSLYEASRLAWRNNAIRLVILFTDAPGKDPDPGPDVRFGTADDIQSNDVYASLREQNIRIFAVQASAVSLFGLSLGGDDTQVFLREAARQTDGEYFAIADAESIPSLVIESVGGAIRNSRMRFVPRLGGTTVENGFTQSPTSFGFPENGESIRIDTRFCPAQADLSPGTYNLTLDLQSGRRNLGTVNASVTYYDLCSDLMIADTPDDDGEGCTTSDIFWDSPSIVVRHAPDEGLISQLPRVGDPNYVYIEVRNRGPLPAEGTVRLLQSQALLVPDFPAGWVEVGALPVTLDGNSSIRLGPLQWVATRPFISLRAIVTSDDDPVDRIIDEEDIACENSVAVQHRMAATLDNPTYAIVPQQFGNVVILPAIGNETIDVAIPTANFDGYIQALNAGDAERLSDGATLRQTVLDTLRLLVVGSGVDGNVTGELPVRVQSRAGHISGATIYYQIDTTTVQQLRSAPVEEADDVNNPLDEQALLFGGLLGVIAFVILLFVIVGVLRNRNDPSESPTQPHDDLNN